MTQYLFLFTIGPVQSFIEQARKTHDLKAGSDLLSHLIDSTMKQLDSQCSIEFIFPNESISSKPNRFFAKVESDNIQKIGEYAKSSVINEFETIACKLLSELKLPEPGDFKSQINDLLYANWAALPLEKDNYAERYAEIEKYLGAIKNVRQFHKMEEEGRKCSLCGERNVLFYRGKKRRYVPNDAVSLNELSPKYVMDGEGLCAVCFTKRSFSIKNSYPSVAEISLMDTLDKLDSTLKNEYKGLFGTHFDEELYFESNLTEEYFKKYCYPDEKLESAKDHLKKIKNDAKNKNIGFPTYYAVIMFDGDSMGKWLSGEYLKEKSQLMEFHKKLTKKLGNFSKKVEEITQKPKGKLVYAGGDDALAFINLNHLLPVIKEVRGNFPKFEEIDQVSDKKTSSVSCGICISHYKTQLSETLRWARKMEKEAKKIDRKNAFAIAVLKRSGETRETVYKWEYNSKSTVQIMEELIHALKNDFSDTFIKNLSMEFGWLKTESMKPDFEPLIKTEMKRLIRRSCMMRKKENESKEEFEDRKKDAVDKLYEYLESIYSESKSFENFISFLDIAVFIKREINKCK